MAACIGLLAAPAARGATVTLHASLTPERLGHGSTLGFDLDVSEPNPRALPPALTAITLRYPANLGIATSGLGFATCQPQALQTGGYEGCPNESLMGRGTARAAIPFGPETIRENAKITIYRAPTREREIALLIYAVGMHPVATGLIFPALLQPAPTPYGGQLNATIPPIAGLPGTPNAALTSLTATIGPQDIAYTEHTHGKTTPYHPKGILLPDTCPPRGFPFAARLDFENTTTPAEAHTTVPCPTEQHTAAGGRRTRRQPIRT